ILPRAILRRLTEQEMAAYRAPFRTREDRLPTLIWPRQIPIGGEPADVTAIVEKSGKAMARSPIPKLLIVGNPRAIVRGRTLDFWPTWAKEAEVQGNGVHFLQEDSPHEIGSALEQFIQKVIRGESKENCDDVIL